MVDNAARTASQQKTFTRWVNTHLDDRGLSLVDLQTDLASGMMLGNLIEILSGKQIGKLNPKASMKVQQIENLSKALTAIQREGIPLVNISAEDVHGGNLKIILGLIWTLILRFQINKATKHSEDGGGGKGELLAWINGQLQPYNLSVRNFSSDFQDPRVLAALVDSLGRPSQPHSLADIPDAQASSTLRGASLRAWQTEAQNRFEIPPVMDAQDMADHPDELSCMTYVSYFREAARAQPLVQEQTAPAAGKAIKTFLYTSESVNEGHPDKLCDQVSDAVLDACLAQDPYSRVACETSTKTGLVMVFGEITTKAKVNYEKVVRNTLREIGYDDADKGIDFKSCDVVVAIEQQSPDIAQGVHVGKAIEDIGAGDQGHMFGYATDETEDLMPLTHSLATKLGARLTEVRKTGILPWVRPDGKTQVVIEYREEGGAMIPQRLHTLVISTQHAEDVTNEQIRSDLMEHVVKPVVPANLMDEHTVFHLNPSGRFVIGGPHGDAGLTGRKIIIDTYGGWGAHGGGAFSGKDPTKVDRSAAYMCRWIAKSLVAAKLCRRCLVQVGYAIGVAEPLSVHVDTYGSAVSSDVDLLAIIKQNFDLRPGCIARDLDLHRPIYQHTAAYGHFGRDVNNTFTWEHPKKLVF